MKVSYFPGCTLRTKAKQLDYYARKCAEILGAELCEIKDWQCCGGVFVSAKDEIASKLSSVRALVSAKEENRPLVTVCSACHNVIKQTNYAVQNDETFAARVNTYMAQDKDFKEPYNGETEVIHYLELLRDKIGFDKIKEECEANNTPLPEYEISERGIMVLCKPGEKYLKLLKKYGLGTKEENVTDNVTDARLIKILKLSENSKKTVRMLGIIEMIKNENISVTEMAESLGVTTRTIKRDIDYLKKMKVVKREGTAKSGKWIISIE